MKNRYNFRKLYRFFCILNAHCDSISRLFHCLTKDSVADYFVVSDSVFDFGFDCRISDSGNSAVDSGSVPDSDFDVTSMHSFSPHKAAVNLPQPVRYCKRHFFLTAQTVPLYFPALLVCSIPLLLQNILHLSICFSSFLLEFVEMLKILLKLSIFAYFPS